MLSACGTELTWLLVILVCLGSLRLVAMSCTYVTTSNRVDGKTRTAVSSAEVHTIVHPVFERKCSREVGH
jgi:hypothetical protein